MSADAPGIRPFRSADLERIRQITVESFEGVSIDRNIEAQFGQVAGRDWRERKARDVIQQFARNVRAALRSSGVRDDHA